MTTTRRTFIALTAASAGAALIPSVAFGAPSRVKVVTRTFRGIYTVERQFDDVSFDITVEGWEAYWPHTPDGRWVYTYEVGGRKRSFTVDSPTPLSDTDVLAEVFEQLVERAKAHPGILGQMAARGHRGKHYPVWLFRTSVLDYRITGRTTRGSRGLLGGISHTSVEFDGLVAAGRVGPVV